MSHVVEDHEGGIIEVGEICVDGDQLIALSEPPGSRAS